VEKRPFNVSLFSFHNDMLIIFKKKLISINKCNFKFTNIETVRIINIGNEIVDKNSIISIESGFQTS
jgi:hypothetical protein